MRMDERIARIEDSRRRVAAAAADPRAMSDVALDEAMAGYCRRIAVQDAYPTEVREAAAAILFDPTATAAPSAILSAWLREELSCQPH